MEELTSDSTAANGETLKLELKKILTEILSHGGEIKAHGSFRVLEATDEANIILNLLREVESKMPESDLTSSSTSPKVQVPKVESKMPEPVVIASGQTYQKRYIIEWLKHEHNCPKSNAVLCHDFWTKNQLVDELIKQWCRANKYDLLKPSDEIVNEQFKDGIKSLLQRISSNSLVEDQTEAANELRRQTKKFVHVRAFFVCEIPDSITRLLSPLSALGEAVDSNSDLQKNIITALRYISTFEQNKRVIAKNPLVIPLLTKSLKQGTAKTRRNSAAALSSLSVIDSNKIIIGNPETLKALIDLIREGDFSATIEATFAVFNLCILLENREKAVSEGLISVLTNKIEAGINVKNLLAVLALMSTHNREIKEMAMEEHKEEQIVEQIVELPLELVLEEIIARVPIESQLRFRSTCKAFNKRGDYVYKNIDLSQERFLRVDEMVRVINPVANVVRSTTMPDCLEHVTFISTIIQCDGLVLFRNPERHGLTIWNPLTKQVQWIEPMDVLSERDCYGFGYSANKRTCYKLLRIYIYDAEFKEDDDKKEDELQIYETETRSWKRVDASPLDHVRGYLLKGKCTGLQGVKVSLDQTSSNASISQTRDF